MSGARSVYLTGVGDELSTWEIDSDRASAGVRSTVRLPAPAMYAWPDADRRFLYVACSDGGPYTANSHHWITAWAIGRNGDLTPHGDPVRLVSRPIHVSLDRAGRHVLIAYNAPSAFTVHRIKADGRVGSEVSQAENVFGFYGHQVLTTPNDNAALFVCRGTKPRAGEPEDPGSIHLFEYDDGRMTHRGVTALGDGGIGFGPRHFDYEPSGRFALLGVERQSRLMVFGLSPTGELTSEPVHDVSTLADASPDRQAVGFVRAHPRGHVVYVSNRSIGPRLNGMRVFDGGEDDIAVISIDGETGTARVEQHADPGLVHIRNGGIDRSGRVLCCTSIAPVLTPDGLTRPAGMAVLEVDGDGRLALRNRYDIDTGTGYIFWSGLIDLA